MNLVERLNQRFRRRQEEQSDPVEAQAAFEWPNRETRRRLGIRFPVGLTTSQHLGLQVFDEPYVPRYARRHWAAMANLKTRRNRRHRARILRAIAPLGRTTR